MIGLNKGDDPEEEIDIGKKDEIGEHERVAVTPFPKRVGSGEDGRGGRGAPVVPEEVEIEEDGRERSNQGNCSVLQISECLRLH